MFKDYRDIRIVDNLGRSGVNNKRCENLLVAPEKQKQDKKK